MNVKKENGEVMIEGMIILILTTFMLIWILAIGYLYYQHYLIVIYTNDGAAKVAATYNNPDSDIIMGYMEAENFATRPIYRNIFNKAEVEALNQKRAEAYVKHFLEKNNLTNTINDINVQMKLVSDSAIRKHVELTTTVEFSTPFDSFLEKAGFSTGYTSTYTSCAECTDYIDYFSTIEFFEITSSDLIRGTKFKGLLNAVMKIYNHKYKKVV